MTKDEKQGRSDKKAFTLIEVITVLFIVSIGMIGVLSLIVQNIASQSLNKNTLVAYQLAQEGIELIREVRDTNWRQTPRLNWRTNLAAGHYYMDYTDTVPTLALTPNCTGCILPDPGFSIASMYGNLYLSSDGTYVDNPFPSPAATNYYRIITLSDSDSGMLVVAHIYWTDHDRVYEYSLETMLYDWL
ncbi:MAG: prepilin-type N-terminal cleavage/methylation domain-containing protein [Patescibacteria group bacterium]